MRLQLRIVISYACVLACAISFSQIEQKVKLKDIEASFITSYYEQDGVHSPVTGGQGTEFLTNVAPSFGIVIPIDTAKTLSIDTGVDFYSSASSDNVDNPYMDPNHVSGASAQDARAYATFGLKKKLKNNGEIGYMAGFSGEFDVASFSAGMSYGLNSADNNRGVEIKANYYYDFWALIYPVEFRNGDVDLLEENTRRSLNSSLVLHANLHRKLSASIAADFVMQNGLLSTPFHRVYFNDPPQDQWELSDIERLPADRLKYPVGLRLNYHLTDFLILKSFYRYYADSWGLDAHTFEITMPIKIGQTLRLYPFYRRLTQEGVDYFKPFGQHQRIDAFYTSDWDLGTFDADKYGLGLSYSPLFGLGRFNMGQKRLSTLKAINLRYARYKRSDGLAADVISLGLDFKIARLGE